MSLLVRPVSALLVSLAVVACDGGGTSTTPAIPPGDLEVPGLVTDDDPGTGEVGVPTATGSEVAPPDDAPEVPVGAALRIATAGRCTTVGETFELAVDLESPPGPDGRVPSPIDVSASVTLTQSLGEGLELLARGDDAISLRMNTRDIVALRADIADAAEPSAGRTVYVAGFAADAPASALMTKPVPGGCLYALRLPEESFCGTALVRDGSASLGSGDTFVAIEGCTYELPEGLPVIELPAGPGADLVP